MEQLHRFVRLLVHQHRHHRAAVSPSETTTPGQTDHVRLLVNATGGRRVNHTSSRQPVSARAVVLQDAEEAQEIQEVLGLLAGLVVPGVGAVENEGTGKDAVSHLHRLLNVLKVIKPVFILLTIMDND